MNSYTVSMKSDADDEKPFTMYIIAASAIDAACIAEKRYKEYWDKDPYSVLVTEDD